MIAKFKKSKKSAYRRVFFLTLIGILFLGAISFLIISNLGINYKRTELINRKEALRKEIQILQERNEQLRAGLIQTESEIFWEEKLREQGYKRPGEKVVVVVPPEEAKEPAEKEKSFWGEILKNLGF